MIDISFVTPIAHLLFFGTCDIYETKPVKDERTGRLKGKQEVLKYEKLNCELSHQSLKVSETSDFPQSYQEIKLFLDPDVEVEPGSRVVITQNGTQDTYYTSSKPNRFDSHIEVELSLKKVDL